MRDGGEYEGAAFQTIKQRAKSELYHVLITQSARIALDTGLGILTIALQRELVAIDHLQNPWRGAQNLEHLIDAHGGNLAYAKYLRPYVDALYKYCMTMGIRGDVAPAGGAKANPADIAVGHNQPSVGVSR
jgi:hypothetical protein